MSFAQVELTGSVNVADVRADCQQIVDDDSAMATPPSRFSTHDCRMMILCQTTSSRGPALIAAFMA
jgi:hypothetical protein